MDRPDPEDSFLTVADVAEVLKLNQQTVRNWIDQGFLPAVRVGRRVRIKRSDFERVLAEGYTGAGGSTGQETGPTAEDFWGGEPVGVVVTSSRDARPGDGNLVPQASGDDQRTGAPSAQPHGDSAGLTGSAGSSS